VAKMAIMVGETGDFVNVYLHSIQYQRVFVYCSLKSVVFVSFSFAQVNYCFCCCCGMPHSFYFQGPQKQLPWSLALVFLGWN